MANEPSTKERSAGPTLAGFAFLLLASVLPGLAVIVLMPVLPAIEAHFGGTPRAATLVRAFISSISVAMVVGPVAASALADRFGIRPILLLALAVYGLAGAAGFLLDDLVAILATRFAVGLASAATLTLSVAFLATRVEAAEREKWMGWIAAAGIAGSVLVAPLAGAIGNIGWRYAFLPHLVALPLAVLAAIGIPPGRAAPGEAAQPKTAAGPRLPASVWALMILASGGGAVMNAIPLFLPFHLNEIGAGRPSHIAVAMMTSTVAGTISVAYGPLRRWLSMRLIFAAGLATSGVGLMSLGAVNEFPLVLAGVLATGMGLGIIVPNINALAAAISPPGQSSRVIGLVIGSFSLGGPLAQVAMELIAKGEPARTSILWLGGLSLGLSLVWLIAGQGIRPRTQEARPA